jgi:hypothetical protein
MKFHVFHGSIPIGIAIGIGIDCFKVSGFKVSVARDPLETGLPPGAEIAYA